MKLVIKIFGIGILKTNSDYKCALLIDLYQKRPNFKINWVLGRIVFLINVLYIRHLGRVSTVFELICFFLQTVCTYFKPPITSTFKSLFLFTTIVAYFCEISKSLLSSSDRISHRTLSWLFRNDLHFYSVKLLFAQTSKPNHYAVFLLIHLNICPIYQAYTRPSFHVPYIKSEHYSIFLKLSWYLWWIFWSFMIDDSSFSLDSTLRNILCFSFLFSFSITSTILFCISSASLPNFASCLLYI